MNPRRVEIEIDTLSFDRPPQTADARLVATAFRRELRGRDGSDSRIPGSDPDRLGDQIAAALLRELGR